jgi:hypothetical protein
MFDSRKVYIAIGLGIILPLLLIGANSLSAQQRAETSGNTIAGRDTIVTTFGLTPEQVQGLTKEAAEAAAGPLTTTIVDLSKRLGVTQDATLNMLRILGQEDVPLEQLPERLAEVAYQYKKMQAQLATPPPIPMHVQVRAWFYAQPTWLESLVVVVGLILVWCGLLFALWGIAPGKLVALHERLPDPKALDQATESMDKLTAGLSKALRLLGVAALLLLGTSRRALDAWVAARVPEALDQFTRLKVVQNRQIALDLPIMLDGSRLDQAWAALDVLFRSSSLAMLIVGPGGAGKTTLACCIGRRALGEKGTPPGGFLCLPLLVDRDLEPSETKEGFVPFLAGMLRVMVSIPRLSVKLAEALLRSGRVVVIVDGLSERNETTRRAFDPSQPNFAIMRLIVSSRDVKPGGMRPVIETLEIPPDALYSFIARYIGEVIATSEIETQRPYEGQCPSVADIHEACGQLKRLLRNNPTTPLFASMWAKEILASGKTPKGIYGVAELIDSYVEKLLAPAVDGNAVHLNNLRLDLVAIAVRELGDRLTPGWLTRTQVLNVLPEWTADSPEKCISPEKRIDRLLNSRLLEEDSRNPELMRIAFDSIAEHLVARDRVETLADNIKRWESFLDRVKKRGCPAGFVDALLQCLEARGYSPAHPVSGTVHELLVELGKHPVESHDSAAIPSASLVPA